MKLLKLLLAGLYLLSPIDLVPEILLGPFGLVDDLGALIYILTLFFSSDNIRK